MYFIGYSCLFFIISRRYLQLKQDQDFPDLVKACSLCSTVLYCAASVVVSAATAPTGGVVLT